VAIIIIDCGFLVCTTIFTMSKKKKQKIKRNAAYIKKNAIDINKTQMMVGKQWVKR